MTSNPILWRERRKLFRAGPAWWLALIVVWVLSTWFFRIFFLDWFRWSVGVALPLEVVDVLEVFLNFFLRPELPLALYFFSRMLTPEDWSLEKPHLATTFVTPSNIAFGKIAIPLLILVILNFLTGPYVYYRFMEQTFYGLGLSTKQFLAMYFVVAPLAMIEDIMISALIVMYAFYQTTAAGARGVGPAVRTIAFTVTLAACMSVLSLLAALLPFPVGLFLEDFLRWFILSQLLFFLVVLPLEAFLLSGIWSGCVRRVERRLHDD